MLLRSSPARRSSSARSPFSSLASLSLLVRRPRVPTARVLVLKDLAAELLDVVEVVAVAVAAVVLVAVV